MGAALVLERLKLRRAVAPRIAAACVVLLAPAFAATFTGVALAEGDSVMAVKVRLMMHGQGWEAYLAMLAQLLSVAVLLAVGVVVCWSFGREHTDGTFGSLFALPTSRESVAAAKVVVLSAWGAALCVGAVVVAVPLGMVVGVGAPDPDLLPGAGRALAVGLLTVLLTLPLALVCGLARGYLPGIAALLGLVVLTQLAVLTGAGAWFPYASPGLWAGLGGPAAASAVTVPQLLLAVPVGVSGALATVWWWSRAEVR